ncbi:MAG: hypothetical protein AAF591_02690, partial [Verrucomicrobiota bacterium]
RGPRALRCGRCGPGGDRESLSREVGFDPEEALFGGASGTEVIERFVRDGAGRVRSGGLVALEIGMEQGAAVAELVEVAGFEAVNVEKDLAERERFVFGRKA